MKDIIISETAEVFAQNLETDSVFFCGITTKGDVTQKIQQTDVKGGIGNGIVAVLQSDKTIEFGVTTALHNDDVYAIQSGTQFTTDSLVVQKTEKQTLNATMSAGTPQVNTLALTGSSITAGTIRVTFQDSINDISRDIDVLGTDTTTTIASKVVTALNGNISGWTVTSTTGNIVFTRNKPLANENVNITLTDVGTSTGVTGADSNTTAGVAPTATGSATLSISGTPYTNNVIVYDCNGIKAVGTYSGGTVTITSASGLTAGLAEVVYQEEVDNANILDLKNDVFPTGHLVQLHSIAYNRKTNKVVADIYWIFDQALPDGSINASYEGGKNNGDEIKFKALAGDNGSYGRYAVIPRA